MLRHHTFRAAAAVLIALGLGACATTGGGPVLDSRPAGAPLPGSPPLQGTPPLPAPNGTPRLPPIQGATPLATEERFLKEWFRGTPVVISTQPPSLLQVSVPLSNSFDAGKSDIKPALNAVLDRVAESMRRHVGARVAVTSPPDANGAAALAEARSQRVRESLGTKGISSTRVTTAEAAQSGPLLLQLAMPAMSSGQPVARRAEPAPDRPAGGVKAVSTGGDAPLWTEKKKP